MIRKEKGRVNKKKTQEARKTLKAQVFYYIAPLALLASFAFVNSFQKS